MIAKRAFNALENKLATAAPNDAFMAVMGLGCLFLILLGMFTLGMLSMVATVCFTLAYDAHYGTFYRKQAKIDEELARILEDK